MTKTSTIAAIGEILVEYVSHKPNCGLTTVGDYSGPYPSGAPAIFADQAARMGGATEMVGGIGDDGFGKAVLNRLKADSVGVTGVTINQALTTGVAFVSYYDTGARDFIFHLTNTAADHFSVPAGLLTPKETILHVSAASLGNAAMRESIMGAVRSIDDAGGRISCDPNARPELMRDAATMDAVHEVIDRSYFLLPSTSDLQVLYPDLSQEAAAEKLFASNAQIVALKRGADGATIIGGGERHDFDGHIVTEVDPTGAGDCFCGTFISLLAQGAPLYEAGRLANAAGAIAVTRRGPMEGNSNPSEITDFLKTSSPKEHSA